MIYDALGSVSFVIVCDMPCAAWQGEAADVGFAKLDLSY